MPVSYSPDLGTPPRELYPGPGNSLPGLRNTMPVSYAPDLATSLPGPRNIPPRTSEHPQHPEHPEHLDPFPTPR